MLSSSWNVEHGTIKQQQQQQNCIWETSYYYFEYEREKISRISEKKKISEI